MKPLGHKNYGSIGHLPKSRLGDGDHHVTEGQSRICQEKERDRHDIVIVQEKLDGSNVGVAKVEGKIVALGRAGYLAQTSKFKMHQLFATWVRDNAHRFKWLEEKERVCGEWLAQAHGTRYKLKHDPFVAFDIMRGNERETYNVFVRRVAKGQLVIPQLISYGKPVSIDWVMKRLNPEYHGAIDPIEGAVWRIERKGVVDFLAKFVRHEKVDGKYLPGCSTFCGEEHWNWDNR